MTPIVCSHCTPYLSTWACYRFLLINLSHHQHNSAKKCISPQLPSPVLQSRGSIQKTRDDLHTNPEDVGTPSSYWKNMCTWSIFGVITRWSVSTTLMNSIACICALKNYKKRYFGGSRQRFNDTIVLPFQHQRILLQVRALAYHHPFDIKLHKSLRQFLIFKI